MVMTGFLEVKVAEVEFEGEYMFYVELLCDLVVLLSVSERRASPFQLAG